MNRGRGRAVDGGGGRWQRTVRGRSSGSGGRSTIQRDHDVCNKYSYNGNPSGGRGSSNQNKVEESDQKSVNGRRGNEGTRGNSYRQGGCYASVRSKEEARVRQFDQGQAAPKGACGSSRSNVSSAYSVNNTRVDIPSLYDQARPGFHGINASNTQLFEIPVSEVEKGTGFITESLRSMNVSQAEIWQPLEPVINSTPYGNEKNVLSDVPGNKCSDPSEVTGYDICFAKTETTVTLKPSLFAKNREKRNETQRATEGRRGEILQSGLILLKNHLSITEQAQIVNICRKLGQGHGGFYQPGYQDGAKLHLKMMCLGKNWDPETSQYVDVRPVDGAKPPPLPFEFTQLVQRAIQESHQLIKEQVKTAEVENILPSMSPDLCIVNFYTASGRLGLHQDRDESEESLKKRLPVVSFSIGDRAEFLYSEQRDVVKADKVLLESGDVLLFGGKSRDIFHGVEKILPNTAPKSLLEESNLRPGRLNLTFRQF
ncbi:hypothetical protein QQ045_014836 [Rhodiola kirilowii]